MSDPFDTHGLTWRITPDLLAIIGSDGAFRCINPSWTRVLGLTEMDMLGQEFRHFVHPEDVDRSVAAFSWIREGSPVLGFENRYRHADGSYRWLSWNAVPEGPLFFCSARDVTVDRNTASDLAARTLEGRQREEFIAVLGHDLRNPLAAVSSALHIIRRDPGATRVPEVVDMAENAVDRMSELIDNLLDFARARLGGDIGISLDPEVDLRPVVAQTVEELRASNPDAVFIEEYGHGGPIACDPDRIGQLVSNLLGNATTHGDRTRPVRISTLDDGPAVLVSVTNFGVTIPPDRHDALFEPFTRNEDGRDRDGLGLGLYISKSIAAGHGGSLGVDSNDGLTTFTLRLPRTADGAPAF